MKAFEENVINLIEEMVDIFQEKAQSKQISERIVRGRKPASASDFEEYLAKLVEKHTPEDIYIKVDSPLSFKAPSVKRKKRSIQILL
ncbi:MAG: hypothetical protein ACFCU8_14485 [Thermosynechococcaceae cyanobacterium]